MYRQCSREDRGWNGSNRVGVANVMRMGISIHYLILVNDAKNDLHDVTFTYKDTLRKLNCRIE